MTDMRFSGPMALRLDAFLALNRIAIATYMRHAVGRRMAPDWGADMEIGVRFTRRQFTRAMARIEAGQALRGRQVLDALQLATDDTYAVKVEEGAAGCWYRPNSPRIDGTLLYFRGGGYAFHGAMSARFAAMLAHHTGTMLYAPDYRLTPDHPHPAQAEDAMAAWDLVTRDTDPAKVVVIGDSAGGHMVLMHLLALHDAHKPQPALAIGMCPWTDIGARGASLTGNDPTDLVQGWMAIRFGEWLDPDGTFGREALSPISHDFSGLAPLYLQAGGREVLRDMIRDFADVQAEQGADIRLDEWPAMPHDFQLYDSFQTDAADALAAIRGMVDWALGEGAAPNPRANTRQATGPFAPA